MAVASKNIAVPDLVQVNRALLSVSDKTGLVEFAARARRSRHRAGLDRRHREGDRGGGHRGARCQRTDRLPEIMDGRVKTLHPAVHGGLLGVRDDPEHVRGHARATTSSRIDLVVVNLYPFEEVPRSARGYAQRSRTSTSAGRRWCAPGKEPRLCRHRHRSGRLCGGTERAGAQHR